MRGVFKRSSPNHGCTWLFQVQGLFHRWLSPPASFGIYTCIFLFPWVHFTFDEFCKDYFLYHEAYTFEEGVADFCEVIFKFFEQVIILESTLSFITFIVLEALIFIFDSFCSLMTVFLNQCSNFICMNLSVGDWYLFFELPSLSMNLFSFSISWKGTPILSNVLLCSLVL